MSLFSTLEGGFAVVFLGLGMATFISWLLFGRMTMARIERELKSKNIPRPCPWDGPGWRIICYAWAIAFPVGHLNLANDPLIDVPLVRAHATRRDWFRATAMVALTAAMTIVGLVGSWYFDFV